MVKQIESQGGWEKKPKISVSDREKIPATNKERNPTKKLVLARGNKSHEL